MPVARSPRGPILIISGRLRRRGKYRPDQSKPTLRGQTVLGFFVHQEIDKSQSFWLIHGLSQQFSIAIEIKPRVLLTHRTQLTFFFGLSVSQVETEGKCVVQIVRDVVQIQLVEFIVRVVALHTCSNACEQTEDRQAQAPLGEP